MFVCLPASVVLYYSVSHKEHISCPVYRLPSLDVFTQPTLMANVGRVKEKMQIMSLMELVFSRGTATGQTPSRIFSFADIAAHVRLEVDEVEFLVLRALAFGVMKGSIDQVTWIHPSSNK